jgi:hypothetical protein
MLTGRPAVPSVKARRAASRVKRIVLDGLVCGGRRELVLDGGESESHRMKIAYVSDDRAVPVDHIGYRAPNSVQPNAASVAA